MVSAGADILCVCVCVCEWVGEWADGWCWTGDVSDSVSVTEPSSSSPCMPYSPSSAVQYSDAVVQWHAWCSGMHGGVAEQLPESNFVDHQIIAPSHALTHLLAVQA